MEDHPAGQIEDRPDAAAKQAIGKALNLPAVFTEDRNSDFIVADIRTQTFLIPPGESAGASGRSACGKIKFCFDIKSMLDEEIPAQNSQRNRVSAKHQKLLLPVNSIQP